MATTTYTSAHTGATIDNFITGPVPPAKGGTGTTLGILHFSDKKTSSWTATSASLAWANDYPYTGAITCSGVTADHIPNVIFGYNELVSGNYAPYATTGTNIVYIYSKVQSNVTIPTIYCM